MTEQSTPWSSAGQHGVAGRVDALCRSPVMVVGSPRSGTTWVQRVLLSDPRICGRRETHFFTLFWPVLDRVRERKTFARQVGMSAHWDAGELREAISDLWGRTVGPVVAEHPEAELLLEKTPDHANNLPAALELLPTAKVIHVIRDSRAVAASMMAASKGWGQDWVPSTAAEAAGVWQRYTRAAITGGRQLPAGRYTEVHYEDLSADPAAHVARLFDFLGLPIPPERVAAIVAEQQFGTQKAIGGSAIGTARGGGAQREPAGFFRKGQPDAWRSDLTLRHKLTVWRYTRKLMRELGYDFRGRRTVTH